MTPPDPADLGARLQAAEARVSALETIVNGLREQLSDMEDERDRYAALAAGKGAGDAN